ncbi:MAG: glycoside hydrolase family 3 C-terminal domain-containing protein, partial [Lachnospiraceae bacterium]|nr:glycoside hydrolase family 3 C-terminal domain-containing protein [Lachnospiraceae bacterium]
LGIPASMVSDGPHGLRKQDEEADHLCSNERIIAVCFTAGCGTAASFNRELLTQMGEVLGNECQAEGISVILGPAVNIKRSPLCGRNFEYYSEDPLVATEIAGALIKGIQSKNVGTSIKHFLANNQETRRLSSDSRIDERTLHEIYLAAFEGAVKKQKPWTVMCSYNRINGIYAAQNHEYLTKTLRDKWGFDGYVMSDWGAVNDRVEDLKAGLDLEMPTSLGANDKLIVEAVQNGTLDEKIVDTAVERILNIVFRYEENKDKNAVWDKDKDHEMARRVAQETIVLLKNEDILPLDEKAEIAFIGKYAKEPRYQGGGSSHINSFKITSALDIVSEMSNITYTQGFQDKEDKTDEKLLAEAVEAAKKAKAAVIFAGLPDAFESEGFDRKHMSMPDCQNELIEKVAEVQPNTIVVLHNGSPVEMPWVNKIKGIVEAYLSGQAVGGAVCDILFGKVNPSAKLPETFPLKLEDNPSYLSYFGEGDMVEYREGIFVGYRYYDKKKMDVLFPFGHGLSYTTFEYSNLTVDKEKIKDTDTMTVSVDVTNTGKMAGKEVVQLYVADKKSKVIRPVKELRDFTKVELAPGETNTVSFILDKRAFAYYSVEIHDWHVETGEFDILIGKSSRDIVLSKTVTVESTVKIPFIYTTDTTVGDVMEDPRAWEIAKNFMGKGICGIDENNLKDEDDAGAQSVKYTPLRGPVSFQGGVSMADVQRLVDELNALE